MQSMLALEAYLEHLPGGCGEGLPGVIQEVGEEDIREEGGWLRRVLGEDISPTEESVTEVRLAHGVSCPHES